MDNIDLRSDTVTWPTVAMRKAMAEAPVGDDVYGDDPGVNELEALAAQMTGKEAAIFVPSGTFGNQLALFTWCSRGSEIILGEDCHIVQHEAGASAVIAGVQTRTVPAPRGIMDSLDVESRIRGEDIHYPDTSLVCMENAHASGRIVPLEDMAAVTRVARSRGIPVHLDGARLFNAAVGLGVPAAEVAGYADSVMFCLSKGLCAPVGSMLAGPKDFIAQARRKRKIMGGGMRQVGILAAAGLIALREMTLRLGDDHQNARMLAGLLSQIPGVSMDLSTVDINMVFFTVQPEPDPAAILAAMARRGIVMNPPENGHFRFVTHYWVDAAAVTKAAAAFAEVLAQIR